MCGLSYRLGGPASNPGEGEIFSTYPERPWSPHNLLYNVYRDFLGGKERLGRDAEPSPPSSATVKKEKSYTSNPPPYGPYSLYRPSVPVQYSYTSTPPMDHTACTELQCLYSTAIPLLPLWTVRPEALYRLYGL